MVQWIRIHLPMQGTRELRPHMSWGHRKPEHHSEDPAWSKQNKTKTQANKLKLGRGSAPIERENSSRPTA